MQNRLKTVMKEQHTCIHKITIHNTHRASLQGEEDPCRPPQQEEQHYKYSKSDNMCFFCVGLYTDNMLVNRGMEKRERRGTG
jgi:hypothetical protein